MRSPAPSGCKVPSKPSRTSGTWCCPSVDVRTTGSWSWKSPIDHHLFERLPDFDSPLGIVPMFPQNRDRLLAISHRVQAHALDEHAFRSTMGASSDKFFSDAQRALPLLNGD